MGRDPLSLDTAPEIEWRQIEAWRRMTPAQKLGLSIGMSDVVGIVRVQGERLDRVYLDANAPLLDVADLLARALASA